MHEKLRKLLARAGVMDANDGNGNDLGGGAGGTNDGGNNAGGTDNGDNNSGKSNGGADDGGKKNGDDGGDKKPTEEEARLLKENMKRKEKERKLAAELEEARNQLKKFDGLDVEAVRKLLAEQKTAEEKQMEAKGEWDRLKARMSEEHTAERQRMQEQINALQEQIKTRDANLNNMTIGAEFSNSEFINKELVLTPAKTRVVYGDYFELEDGRVVGYDKPRGAKERTQIIDSYGNPLPFDAALRKIVEADPDKNHMLKSSVKQGAGSANQTGSRRQPNAEPKTSTEKIGAGLKSLLGTA